MAKVTWTLCMGRVEGERAATVACRLLESHLKDAKVGRLAVGYKDTLATYLISADRQGRRFSAKEISEAKAFMRGVYETLHALDFSPLLPRVVFEWGHQISMRDCEAVS